MKGGNSPRKKKKGNANKTRQTFKGPSMFHSGFLLFPRWLSAGSFESGESFQKNPFCNKSLLKNKVKAFFKIRNEIKEFVSLQILEKVVCPHISRPVDRNGTRRKHRAGCSSAVEIKDSFPFLNLPQLPPFHERFFLIYFSSTLSPKKSP
jgi:hypothetical protein